MSVWLSVDPLAIRSPHLTPYHFVSNNPVMRIDPNGLTDFENKATGETVSVDDGMDQTVTIKEEDWQKALDFSKNIDGNNPTAKFNEFISNNGGVAVPTEDDGGFIPDKDMFIGFMDFKAKNEDKEVAAWEVSDGKGNDDFIVQPWNKNTSDKSNNDPIIANKFGFSQTDFKAQWHTHPNFSSSAIFKGLSRKDMDVSWDYYGLPVRAIYNANEIYEGKWNRGELIAKPWDGRSYGKSIKK